jgi:hypothetical protein
VAPPGWTCARTWRQFPRRGCRLGKTPPALRATALLAAFRRRRAQAILAGGDTLLGKTTIKMFSGQIGSKVFYTVGCTEIPKGVTALKTSDEMLDDGIAGSAMVGKVVSKKTIKLGNIEGREAVIEALEGKVKIRLRVFIAKDRLYQVVTLTTKANAAATEITDFLDSFKLTGK